MPLKQVNATVCDFSPGGLSRLISAVNNNFNTIAKGGVSGGIVRFRLQEPLSGRSASADIKTWDGHGFSLNRSGVVNDEDGVWVGKTGDEGWATQRGNSDGQYSILWMVTRDINGKLNQTYFDIISQVLQNEDFLTQLSQNATFLAFFENLFDTILAGRNFIVIPDQDIAKGGTDGCTIYVNEVTTGVSLDFKAKYAAVTGGKGCIAWVEPGSGTRFVAPWEC